MKHVRATAGVQHRQPGAKTTEVEACMTTYSWFVLLPIISTAGTSQAIRTWTVVEVEGYNITCIWIGNAYRIRSSPPIFEPQSSLSFVGLNFVSGNLGSRKSYHNDVKLKVL